MIITNKIICKNVSSENNISEDVLLSINNIVFNEILLWIKEPTSLKIYLKHFGSWFFKRRKTLVKLKILERAVKEIPTLLGHNKIRLLKRIDNYNFILKEYETYLKEKYEIKCKKYGKENYEAFCLAKRQEKIQKSKKDKSFNYT